MIVWSYGGGVQSAAIAVLILQNRLLRPDLIVMADTTREKSATWQYLNEVVQPQLSKIDLKVEVIKEADSYALEENGKLLLPVYLKDGGKLRNFCSHRWKRDVIHRWLKKRKIERCEMWLGISWDEIERMKISQRKWVRYVYPLIEMVRMRREECIRLVEDFGWPTPPKSSCYMRPNASLDEWIRMKKEHPEDFIKALNIEAEIRQKWPDVYLHKKLSPLSSLKEDFSDKEESKPCDGGFCFT